MQDEDQRAQTDQQFSEPWEQSDVVLLVEGQHFHVHRVILAMSSPVFSRMFSSDFKEKDGDEIPLPEKKAAEIREMLMAIYPRFCKPVNEASLHTLLPLAQEYQMTVLSQRCEDYLLRSAVREDQIGPILETLIVAQNYTLERLIAECVNKTQKLALEEVQGHELYEQVEPLSQRKMIELQMTNMEKKLRDAKAELLESKAEISKLQDKIRKIKDFASGALEAFERAVDVLGSHIRFANKIRDSSFSFAFTTEQNLATIRSDNNYFGNETRSAVCKNLSSVFNYLKELQDNLKRIRNSN